MTLTKAYLNDLLFGFMLVPLITLLAVLAFIDRDLLEQELMQ